MSNVLTDRAVYLTGASRGIGRALALRLAREGVRLAFCGRDSGALETLREELESGGARATFYRAFDLRDADTICDFYREARGAVGPPHVLINNAGFNSRKAPVSEVTTPELDDILAVNLRAPFILMRASFEDMRSAGSGHVVNILSTVCHASMENMGAYTAAKKGLDALTDVFRKEARPHGIRVTSIYPGGTDTEFRPSERPDYMHPRSVAETVVATLTLPQDVVLHHVTFRPMVETNF